MSLYAHARDQRAVTTFGRVWANLADVAAVVAVDCVQTSAPSQFKIAPSIINSTREPSM